MEIMRDVEINNQELQGLLGEWTDFAFEGKPYNDFNGDRFLNVGAPGHAQEGNREFHISDEYRDLIMSKGSSHNGFPETGKFWDMRSGHKRMSLNQKAVDGYKRLDNAMQTTLATKGNALANTYPPGGFISWHNNANAPSYNLIITWSENGDGYWKHVNPYTGETETVQDKPGWQCKAFYFGAYADQQEDLVYHMASTDCWRMTLSYIFDRVHKQFWEDIIEEIETP